MSKSDNLSIAYINSECISNCILKRIGNIVIITFTTKSNSTCPAEDIMIKINGDMLVDQHFVMSGYQNPSMCNTTRVILYNNTIYVPSNSFTSLGSAYAQVVSFIKS